MPNPDHLKTLKQGVDAWNAWRKRDSSIAPDLHGADLSGTDLSKANLSEADLSGANLFEADLHAADLSGANVSAADLSWVGLVEADITDADLTGCRIYGVSAWGLKLSDKTSQRNLIITRGDEPEVTVDNIEVAQFIYLMLNNQKIREVIDTITSKGSANSRSLHG